MREKNTLFKYRFPSKTKLVLKYFDCLKLPTYAISSFCAGIGKNSNRP